MPEPRRSGQAGWRQIPAAVIVGPFSNALGLLKSSVVVSLEFCLNGKLSRGVMSSNPYLLPKADFEPEIGSTAHHASSAG